MCAMFKGQQAGASKYTLTSLPFTAETAYLAAET